MVNFLVTKLCWIAFACLSFYQFLKFLQTPIGTTYTKVKMNEKDYPVVIICPEEPFKYDQLLDYLGTPPNDRQIKTDYLWMEFAKRQNSNDVFRGNFNKILYTADDIIEKIGIILRGEMWVKTNHIKIEEAQLQSYPLSDTKGLSCPTFRIPSRFYLGGKQPLMINIKFKSANINIKRFSTLIAGENTLMTIPLENTQNFYSLKPNSTMKAVVYVSVSEKLPKMGVLNNEEKEDCETDPNYTYNDELTWRMHEGIYKKFGCTIPFFGGINTTYPICINASVYKHRKTQYNPRHIGMTYFYKLSKLKPPCRRISVLYGQPKIFPSVDTRIKINFDPEITREKEIVLYSFGDFVLDVGSYLGLLVGVSLSQLTKLIEVFRIIRNRSTGF